MGTSAWDNLSRQLQGVPQVSKWIERQRQSDGRKEKNRSGPKVSTHTRVEELLYWKSVPPRRQLKYLRRSWCSSSPSTPCQPKLHQEGAHEPTTCGTDRSRERMNSPPRLQGAAQRRRSTSPRLISGRRSSRKGPALRRRLQSLTRRKNERGGRSAAFLSIVTL